MDKANPDVSRLKVTWTRSFACGHPVIDAQHRGLFDFLSELIDTVLEERPKADIELLLHYLAKHIREHFATEEDVLIRTRYPLLEGHRTMHRDLLDRFGTLVDGYRSDRVAVAALMEFIAYDVIFAHIVNEDLKFALQPVSA